MKKEIQHDRLAQLGEELLREFEAVQPQPVPVEFDRKCREIIVRERKSPVRQAILWTARAAVLVFALIGLVTVAVLSVDALRTPVMHFAAAYLEPESYLEEEREKTAEYTQISFAKADNTTLSVYYDGEDGYQILCSDEFGQRLYNFLSPSIDEAFFQALGVQLVATEE